MNNADTCLLCTNEKEVENICQFEILVCKCLLCTNAKKVNYSVCKCHCCTECIENMLIYHVDKQVPIQCFLCKRHIKFDHIFKIIRNTRGNLTDTHICENIRNRLETSGGHYKKNINGTLFLYEIV